jgi:hypothetical protein
MTTPMQEMGELAPQPAVTVTAVPSLSSRKFATVSVAEWVWLAVPRMS